MKHSVFFGIGIRIILLFSVAIFGTFISENLRDFFGDTYIGETETYIDWEGRERTTNRSGFDHQWDWGARHYWYYWGVVILFLLSLSNLVIASINLVKKNYDTSKW